MGYYRKTGTQEMDFPVKQSIMWGQTSLQSNGRKGQTISLYSPNESKDHPMGWCDGPDGL